MLCACLHRVKFCFISVRQHGHWPAITSRSFVSMASVVEVRSLADVFRHGYAPSDPTHFVGHFGLFFSAFETPTLETPVSVAGYKTATFPRIVRPDASLHDLCVEASHLRLRLDSTVDMFLRQGCLYDSTLHNMFHLDVEVRGLAFMIGVPRGWHCAVHLHASGAQTNFGVLSFPLLKTGRDITSRRHDRIATPGKQGYFHVDLRYMLECWCGIAPTEGETAHGPSIEEKVLVLLCDFEESAKWCEQLKAWHSDPSLRPEELAAKWPMLNVVVVGRRDEAPLTFVSYVMLNNKCW